MLEFLITRKIANKRLIVSNVWIKSMEPFLVCKVEGNCVVLQFNQHWFWRYTTTERLVRLGYRLSQLTAFTACNTRAIHQTFLLSLSDWTLNYVWRFLGSISAPLAFNSIIINCHFTVDKSKKIFLHKIRQVLYLS